MGLNTIQTYTAWNMHEPTRDSPPKYNFSGRANITRFFDTANDLDLLVILRPGPFICAEWDFGGLPGWLMGGETGTEIGRGLRTSEEGYRNAYEGYMRELLAVVKPYLYANGGPVVMAQVENEYGFYGNDKTYLANLRDLYNDVLGEGNVIIYSTDTPTDLALEATQVEGIFQTCDFGPQPDWSSPADSFAVLRKYQPTGPLMNSEYYTGWISHWGDAGMAHRPIPGVVEGVRLMLEMNASFNMYMFFGGSNFGWMNGANADNIEVLQVTLQSYDYDAPLTEAGDITLKYLALRELLLNTPFPYAPPKPALTSSVPPLPFKPVSDKGAYGKVTLNEQGGLWANVDNIGEADGDWPFPPLFSQVIPDGPATGYMLYKTTSTLLSSPLIIQSVRDYARVYVDYEYQGTADRTTFETDIDLHVDSGKQQYSLEILVENHGRINFGPYLHDQKGIGLGPYLGIQQLFNWHVTALPMDDVSQVKFSTTENATALPSFFRGTLTINDTPLDTYLSFKGWGKGQIYVNNHHIGRYWNVGPQYCVYVPAQYLQKGDNEIVLFELEQVGDGFEVEFLSSSNNVISNSPPTM